MPRAALRKVSQLPHRPHIPGWQGPGTSGQMGRRKYWQHFVIYGDAPHIAVSHIGARKSTGRSPWVLFRYQRLPRNFLITHFRISLPKFRAIFSPTMHSRWYFHSLVPLAQMTHLSTHVVSNSWREGMGQAWAGLWGLDTRAPQAILDLARTSASIDCRACFELSPISRRRRYSPAQGWYNDYTARRELRPLRHTGFSHRHQLIDYTNRLLLLSCSYSQPSMNRLAAFH